MFDCLYIFCSLFLTCCCALSHTHTLTVWLCVARLYMHFCYYAMAILKNQFRFFFSSLLSFCRNFDYEISCLFGGARSLLQSVDCLFLLSLSVSVSEQIKNGTYFFSFLCLLHNRAMCTLSTNHIIELYHTAQYYNFLLLLLLRQRK